MEHPANAVHRGGCASDPDQRPCSMMTRAAAFRLAAVAVLTARSRAVRCCNLTDWSRTRGLVSRHFHSRANVARDAVEAVELTIVLT